MTDKPNQPTSDSHAARQNRLRAALRENLKRRKSQLRGRSGTAVEDDGPAAPVTDDKD